MDAIGDKSAVNNFCSNELERISGGSLFNGICLTNTGSSKSKQKVTVCPQNMEKLWPSMPGGEVYKEIDSIHTKEQMESNLNSLGMSMTLTMGIQDLKLKGSFSKTSPRQVSTRMNSTASQCMVITVPKYAIWIESDKLALDPSFIDALKEFERFVGEDINIRKQLMPQAQKLFDRFGTHINTGVIHIGGLRMFRAHLQCQKEDREQKSQIRLALERMARVGCLGNANYEQKNNNTNKPANASKHIDVETVTIGGCQSESDMTKWRDSVCKTDANLAVIDRSELIGIWELVRKCKGNLRYPKGLALILRWAEEDTKDYTEEEAIDFTKLLLQGFQAKLQTTKADDFDVRAIGQRLDFCKEIVGNNRIIQKVELQLGRGICREVTRGTNIVRDVVICFDELDSEGACADFIKKQADICLDLWNELESNFQMAAIVYNKRSKTVLNQDFDKKGWTKFMKDISLAVGPNPISEGQSFKDTAFMSVVNALRSLSWRDNSRRVVIFVGDYPKSIEELLTHLNEVFACCNATDFKVHWFSTTDLPDRSATSIALENSLGFSNTRLSDKKRVTREILTECCNTVDDDQKQRKINSSNLEENESCLLL